MRILSPRSPPCRTSDVPFKSDRPWSCEQTYCCRQLRQCSADDRNQRVKRAHCQIECTRPCASVCLRLNRKRVCVRTVSHTAGNPGQTPSFTGTRRCTSMLQEVLDENCVGGFCCASLRVSGIDFQACSFNHSDISPLENQRVASGLKPDCRKTGRDVLVFCDGIWIQRFTAGTRTDPRGNCVKPPNLLRSLTAIRTVSSATLASPASPAQSCACVLRYREKISSRRPHLWSQLHWHSLEY